MKFSTEILQVTEICIEAGNAIIEIYNSNDYGIESKNDNSPLTLADKKSHEVIEKGLKKLLIDNKSLPVLSEEGKSIPYDVRKEWNKFWLIDPLDGTKEFIKRNGEFTVNIALIHDQDPIAGFVYIPVSKELYFAWKGFGAFKVSGIDLSNYQTIVNDAKKLSNNEDQTFNAINIVASRSHLSPETESFINKINDNIGSVETISSGSSIKLCMVADGSADVYPRFAPTMEWDTAAAQAICQMAGVRVIDVDTKEIMKYNRENMLNNWFLVSSNRKFEELL